MSKETKYRDIVKFVRSFLQKILLLRTKFIVKSDIYES
jgi:hypothetical protein